MVATIDIKEHMPIIGADGLPVGVVDKMDGERIKLTRDDGHGGKRDHHHFLPMGLVADIEDGKVRLSANAAVALTFREEENGTIVVGEPASAADSAFVFGKTDAPDKTDAPGKSDAPPTSDVHATQKPVPVPPVTTVKEARPASKPTGLGTAALSAVGAVAVGAAALGASKLLKSRGTEDRIPLDNDENVRLISSAKVEGSKVVDRDGAAIGTIQSVMIDKYTGRVAYAILTFGGTFGLGATLFPLPWGALDYQVERDAYVLALTKDQLAQAPKFEARDTPEFDAPYRTRIVAFYRAM